MRTKGSKNKVKREDTKDNFIMLRCNTEFKNKIVSLSEKEGLSITRIIEKSVVNYILSLK